MPQFNDNAKEEVRSRADIAAVVGRYVTLKPSGQTLKGLCPFHKEKTPSFHVNPTQGFYHCFGCGKGGDVFSFIQEMEGIGFAEALSMLAEELGVTLPRYQAHEQSPVTARSGGEVAPQNSELSKTELLRIHELAAQYFYRMIKPSNAAVDYLKSRGLKPETVRDFRLGFAPEGWSGLIDHCHKEQISDAALIACGLAISKENGRCYDRFRNRVMFSLCDLSGRVIGFAGRGMEADAMPKYLNSPETLLYKKKNFLYGLNQSRQAIKLSGSVLVVEGYMDYLTLFQAGICNVVASSGTALTPEHAQLLGRFTRKIILTFDGDSAGQTAAERAIFTLAPFNLDLRVLTLPPEDDPDSMVKERGREAFDEAMKTARTWSDFIIDRMMAIHDASTPRGVSAVVDALAPLARAMQDPIVAHQFKKDLADRLGTEERLIYQKLGGGGGEQSAAPRVQRASSGLSSDQLFCNTLEGSFLRLLIAQPDLILEAQQYVTPETLTDTVSGDIYSLLITSYERDHHCNGCFDLTDDPELRRLLSLLMVKTAVVDHIHEELVQKIVHLRKKYLRHRQRECRVQMKREPHRSDELLRLLKDYSTQLHELDGGE